MKIERNIFRRTCTRFFLKILNVYSTNARRRNILNFTCIYFWYVVEVSRRGTERIETLNGPDMVRRFLITVNWPRSKLRLTGHGQDIFSQVLPRLEIHCSRRPAPNGDREWWKTVFSGQFEARRRDRTKGMVSINRATRLNAHRSNWIEGGRRKREKREKKISGRVSIRVSNFCSIFTNDFLDHASKRSFTSHTFELPILNFDSPVRGFCFTRINRTSIPETFSTPMFELLTSVHYALAYTCIFTYIFHLIDHLRQFWID